MLDTSLWLLGEHEWAPHLWIQRGIFSIISMFHLWSYTRIALRCSAPYQCPRHRPPGRPHHGKPTLIIAQFFALDTAAEEGHRMRQWLYAIMRTTSGDLEVDDCDRTVCTSVTIHFQLEEMTCAHTLSRSHLPHNVMHLPSYRALYLLVKYPLISWSRFLCLGKHNFPCTLSPARSKRRCFVGRDGLPADCMLCNNYNGVSSIL